MFITPDVTTPPQPITVWVHGSRTSNAYGPYVSKKFNELQHRLFHVDNGLHRASDIEPYYYMHHLARIVSQAHPQNYPFETFYLFGWAGDVAPESRKNAGIQLYNSLKKIVEHHTHNGIVPPITLFSHSHGGNVILNMKHAFDHDPDPLVINKTIFIACPVQYETREFIHCPLFKDIHSYHSHADMMQWIDPQGIYPLVAAIKQAKETKSLKPLKAAIIKLWKNRLPLFSQRHFGIHPKIKQAAVSWKYCEPWTQEELDLFKPYAKQFKFFLKLQKKKRALGHLEFMMPSFLRQLPTIIKTTDAQIIADNCATHTDICIDL